MGLTALTSSPQSQQNRDIIRGKIERTIDRFDRYPLLDVIWTLFTRRLIQRLAAFYGVPVEGFLVSKDIQRFCTCFEELPNPALFCVFEAVEWQDSGLIVLDGGIADANLEFLLGGDQDTPFEPELRSATHLDRALARQLVDNALAELQRAFSAARAEIGPVTMQCRRIETSPQFAAITREQTLAFVFRLQLEIGETGRSGQMDVIIPLPMLEPIRRYLTEAYRGEQKANDLVWTRHITDALMEMPLPLDVELERLSVPFERVMGWKVGEVLPLSANTDTPLAMNISDNAGRTTTVKGQMGAMRGFRALKLTGDQAADFGLPLRALADRLGCRFEPAADEPKAATAETPEAPDDAAAFGALPGAGGG